MDREFNPTSALVRTVFAVGSMIVSLLIVSSITSLAEHYNAESVATAQHVVVARQ